MTNYIDCLLIGTNRLDIKAFTNAASQNFGNEHPMFRNYNVDLIEYKGKSFLIEDLYNELIASDELAAHEITPLSNANDMNTSIAYLGTYLKRRGFSFDYVNTFKEGKEELAAKLKNNKYRIIGLTTTNNLTPEPIQEIVQFVRECCDDTPIIAGGKFVAQIFGANYREALPMIFDFIGADYYVNSQQGESTLINLISALKDGDSCASVPNLCYKSDGKYIETDIVPENNLLAENTVDWSLFSNNLKNHACLRTSVGCKFNCAFCVYPLHAGEFQTTTVEAIEYELNELTKTGINWILFSDDTFNVPRDRFKEILKMMLRNNFRFNWASFFRCQFADEETVMMMKESGCKIVIMGLESGNNAVLQNMNKSATVEQYRAGIKLLKKAGIYTVGTFIFGFPGETEQSIAESIELIKETDFYQPNFWIFAPGTPIAERKDDFNLKCNSPFEWSHNTMDTGAAADVVQKIISSITESARMPMCDSNILFVTEMYQRGMTIEQTKQFTILFNKGVAAKFMGQQNGEVMDDIIREMKDLIRSSINV